MPREGGAAPGGAMVGTAFITPATVATWDDAKRSNFADHVAAKVLPRARRERGFLRRGGGRRLGCDPAATAQTAWALCVRASAARRAPSSQGLTPGVLRARWRGAKRGRTRTGCCTWSSTSCCARAWRATSPQVGVCSARTGMRALHRDARWPRARTTAVRTDRVG